MSSRRSTTTQSARKKPGPKSRLFALGVGLIALLLLIVFAPRVIAWYARQQAEKALHEGRITAAQGWLAWASRCRPADGRVDILRAGCCRRLTDVEGFVKALQEAEEKKAPPGLIERERRLAAIQAGRLPPGPNNQIGSLITEGYDPAAVAEAFIYGALARGDFAQAWEILSAWSADSPDDGNQNYMAGIYWQFVNQPQKAEEMHRAALRRQPRHELAMLALAEILSTEDRWTELFQLYKVWQRLVPRSKAIRIGLARCARLLGRWDEAWQWLNSDGLSSNLSTARVREIGELLLEMNYPDEAMKWFERLDIKGTTDRTLLHAVALTESLKGKSLEASQVMDRADRRFQVVTRIHELQMKLTVYPDNHQLRAELENLAKNAPARSPVPDSGSDTTPKSPAQRNSEVRAIYERHCSACHGDQGAGNGRAARFLFPRARNFRRDAFRIVSTEDGIPTVDDVASVIRQGMPGTAMRSFPELSDEETVQLAELVLEMFREGIREQLVSLYAAEGESVSDEDITEEVLMRTTPGNRVSVPKMGVPDKPILDRGKKAYSLLGCANCHGEDGAGPCDLALWDDQGFPNPPRDLRHGVFKGGDQPESLYLRLRIGMPGTAHPSCLNTTPEELVSVVHYCRTLIQEPRRTTTNDQRWREAQSRAWYPAYLSPGGP